MRLHDLTIVAQPEAGSDGYDNIIPQDVLFQAGCPVLFVPYIRRGRFAPKRIGVC